jgi:quercetin dioxygenase-like cupin family protein
MIYLQNIYDKHGWKRASGYPAGTRIKILRNENGARTLMLKFPKGFRVESHMHMYNEQHFVLEGEYESEGKTFSSGDYRFIPAHKKHGSFISKTGGIILIIRDPQNDL